MFRWVEAKNSGVNSGIDDISYDQRSEMTNEKMILLMIHMLCFYDPLGGS